MWISFIIDVTPANEKEKGEKKFYGNIHVVRMLMSFQIYTYIHYIILYLSQIYHISINEKYPLRNNRIMLICSQFLHFLNTYKTIWYWIFKTSQIDSNKRIKYHIISKSNLFLTCIRDYQIHLKFNWIIS